MLLDHSILALYGAAFTEPHFGILFKRSFRSNLMSTAVPEYKEVLEYDGALSKGHRCQFGGVFAGQLGETLKSRIENYQMVLDQIQHRNESTLI